MLHTGQYHKIPQDSRRGTSFDMYCVMQGCRVLAADKFQDKLLPPPPPPPAPQWIVLFVWYPHLKGQVIGPHRVSCSSVEAQKMITIEIAASGTTLYILHRVVDPKSELPIHGYQQRSQN